jgi:methylated-DNA-[protein]-cysteine S-methyltransferase
MATTRIASPIGPLVLAAVDGRLTGVEFVGTWSAPRGTVPGYTPAGRADAGTPAPVSVLARDHDHDASAEPVLAAAARQLAEYFAGERTEFDLPLAPQGDAFHRSVWELIAEIPYGETVSYGSIAARLGGIRLSQAVGSATGSNPLPLVIPCHRVVGADGSLTGFGGGLDRKRYLLALEESDEVKAQRLF